MRDAIKMTVAGLKCDAVGCDYRDNTVKFSYKAYINKPCPKCGANLLTEADAEAAVKIARTVKILNVFYKIFHPIQTLTAPSRKLTMRMNGKGMEGVSFYDEQDREITK
jgi:hypothetical protein